MHNCAGLFKWIMKVIVGPVGDDPVKTKTSQASPQKSRCKGPPLTENKQHFPTPVGRCSSMPKSARNQYTPRFGSGGDCARKCELVQEMVENMQKESPSGHPCWRIEESDTNLAKVSRGQPNSKVGDI